MLCIIGSDRLASSAVNHRQRNIVIALAIVCAGLIVYLLITINTLSKLLSTRTKGLKGAHAYLSNKAKMDRAQLAVAQSVCSIRPPPLCGVLQLGMSAAVGTDSVQIRLDNLYLGNGYVDDPKEGEK